MIFEMSCTICSRCPIMLSILIFIASLPYGEGISCYTCSSWNRSDENCYDPYHPANSLYTEDCKVPKEHHIGQFPANFCLKIIGKKVTTGEQLVIRACIMENMDNQCGVFRFQDDSFQGCILTCDYNGCNTGAHPNLLDKWTTWILATISILLMHATFR